MILSCLLFRQAQDSRLHHGRTAQNSVVNRLWEIKYIVEMIGAYESN